MKNGKIPFKIGDIVLQITRIKWNDNREKDDIKKYIYEVRKPLKNEGYYYNKEAEYVLFPLVGEPCNVGTYFSKFKNEHFEDIWKIVGTVDNPPTKLIEKIKNYKNELRA